MKEGDRVRLKQVDGSHGGLRQDIKIGDEGVITGVWDEDNWYWVEWLEGEPAMRMWPDELEVISPYESS